MRMEIYDFSECEYSNRNGFYGGATVDKVEKNIALVDKNLSTIIDFGIIPSRTLY